RASTLSRSKVYWHLAQRLTGSIAARRSMAECGAMPPFTLDALAAPLPAAPMALALAIVFGAGIVRGFAGFGFSALSVAGLALLVSPARVVPAIFVLEVLASIGLLKSAWRDIDWPWLSWLVAGNALCIPLGIALLAWLPEAPLRLLIGALLVLAAATLRS